MDIIDRLIELQTRMGTGSLASLLVQSPIYAPALYAIELKDINGDFRAVTGATADEVFTAATQAIG